ncbi:hypothetical protein MTX26_10050 [Bradyrhizobium sp. ISRA443]|uniref:hypothetical protein n=1 Tax=unclassified Bradyrhizobium TaxID=2631580 RepID=UPI002478845F|nr:MULTISPECIES: hypothetical protein [unclassified Bradyrhizobium]WGS01128.1 hypothetical protein MTX23_10045 [Bradyrhizobium sp. ISRA436]WGS08015.1 hypothetical protein MTX18_10050 [Bradyrhizobium sp. ISRA437]WGS14903.1 hypothetical protein MTX26_10050 [Bradyrhizobium sp. ISRA443]
MELGLTTSRRCLCCGGVIDGLTDDGATGIEARIGLFSDECAFVCNACTASLIRAAALRKREMVHRKWPTRDRCVQLVPKAS